MLVHGKHYRTIWLKEDDPRVVQAIDQRYLPHFFVVEDLASVDEMAVAIADMHLRGAGLIGAAAGYGMYVAALHAPRTSPEAFMAAVLRDGERLKATRPTAVNLEWAVHRQLAAIAAAGADPEARIRAALATAHAIADEDAEYLPAHRPARREAYRRDQPAQRRRAGQHPHPLQCRLAGLRRLWHRHGADLRRPRRRDRRPCLGGRNPAAQPGRAADRLGAGRSTASATPSSPTTSAAT